MTILYLSQDGIADHIGQSQIAPYVLGLAEQGFDIHLLSLEKSGREAIKAEYRARFAAAGVRWTMLPYHSPLLGTLRDLAAMYRAARRIARVENISLVHSRGHPPMPVALALKRLMRARVLFDFRDFYADSGIAEGRFVPVFRLLKRLERGLVERSDHVNTLTHAAAAHLQRAYPGQRAGWSVIPCCADFDLFQPSDGTATRVSLGIPSDATVLLYLGSIGPVYLVPEMMALFATLRALRPNAVFLLVCNNGRDEIERAAADAGIPPKTLRIVHAARPDIPALIAAADLSVAFKRADLGNLGCSPVKLGETLACGVPVIANPGVGDLDTLLSSAVNGSTVLTDFSPDAMRDGLNVVLTGTLGRAEVRAAALDFSLEAGIATYVSVYHALGERAGDREDNANRAAVPGC